MTLLNNEIFVLLGHNGAGKTTTISMITGIHEPDEGLIEILGKTEFEEIREVLGVCPQENPLYDDLTIREHLELFGSLKGLEGETLDGEIDKLLEDVDLEEKADDMSKSVSGGQKRKLSVAMAFSGDSKVIILDEPTAGMDTYARRYIWEMLKKYQEGRIILLTTHLMDEADYLGDKIGIMVEGKIVTSGTNVFLKNKFGIGYNITFVKKESKPVEAEMMEMIEAFVPQAKVLSDVSLELKIQLPLSSVKRFSEMFESLDKNKDKLNFKEYGISITTLEEVFIEVG